MTTMKDDMISRQVAIETIRKAKDKSEAHRMLVQLPPAQPGWIPCSPETMPGTPIIHEPSWGVEEFHESQPLIFQLRNKEDDDLTHIGILTGTYCDDLNGCTYFSTYDAVSFDVDKVVAWQPLPTPYREGGRNA